jgi:acyl-CoA reductase-like NAD-dependent aldehyde dehydrogenase
MTIAAKMTINGQDVDTSAHLTIANPANGDVLGTAPDAGMAELDAAISAARAAFPKWRAKPYAERQAVVAKIGEVIGANMEELCRSLTLEQGKPAEQAQFEIGGAAAWAGATAMLELPVFVLEDEPGHRIETHHVPIGVVGSISPWNFPVLLSVWKVVHAILAGNTMVLKPSPFTPLTVLRLGVLLRGVIPDGVLNIISGGDALGPMMTSHEGFDKISFTGSTATGRRVMASAAPTLKRVTLELGGNDAAIVMPDVNVAEAAEKVFWSAFTNSGQVCIATKRAYVHDSVYDAFKTAITAIAKAVPMGDGSKQGIALGPINNKLQYDRVKSLLADCKANDFATITGYQPADSNGYFIPVTLVDNPPESSRIVQEEQFGPVLPLLRWSDEADVIARANASEYGLGGTIWTNDIDAALRIAPQLETGSVWINEAMAAHPHAAFGGHKQSGLGSENGIDGLLEYTNPQTITVRRPLAA